MRPMPSRHPPDRGVVDQLNFPALITAVFLLLVLGAVLWYAARVAVPLPEAPGGPPTGALAMERKIIAIVGPDRWRSAAGRAGQRAGADDPERRSAGDVPGQARHAVGPHGGRRQRPRIAGTDHSAEAARRDQPAVLPAAHPTAAAGRAG